MEPSCTSDTDSRNGFVQDLIAAQPWLFTYLPTLLGDVNDADNVLQEANMILWSKADVFRPGTNFRAWAREFAYHCALTFARDRKRERLIVDFNLVENIIAESDVLEVDPKRIALRHCLTELDKGKLELLRERYRDETPISTIAEKHHKTEAAIKMSLRRVRVGLMKCIVTRMATAP